MQSGPMSGMKLLMAIATACVAQSAPCDVIVEGTMAKYNYNLYLNGTAQTYNNMPVWESDDFGAGHAGMIYEVYPNDLFRVWPNYIYGEGGHELTSYGWTPFITYNPTKQCFNEKEQLFTTELFTKGSGVLVFGKVFVVDTHEEKLCRPPMTATGTNFVDGKDGFTRLLLSQPSTITGGTPKELATTQYLTVCIRIGSGKGFTAFAIKNGVCYGYTGKVNLTTGAEGETACVVPKPVCCMRKVCQKA